VAYEYSYAEPHHSSNRIYLIASNSTPFDRVGRRTSHRSFVCSRRGVYNTSMPSTAAAGPGGPSSNGEAAPGPLVVGPQMQPVLLSDPLDEGNLTDAVKFCRRQIEFFTADPEDVHARHKKGGIKQEIYVGQVGIRCVHCARLGKTERPSGSVSYPASISLVYQSVRNWQSELVCCMLCMCTRKCFPSYC